MAFQPYTKGTKDKWQIVETQGFHIGHDGSDRAPSVDRDSTDIPLIACEGGVKGFGIDKYGGLFCRLYTGKASSYLYVHLDRFVGNSNERVEAGEIIGYMGNTGKSTRTHLHFEVGRGGKTINPNKAGLTYYSANKMAKIKLRTGEDKTGKVGITFKVIAEPSVGVRAIPDSNSKEVDRLVTGTTFTTDNFATGETIDGNNVWCNYQGKGWVSMRWLEQVISSDDALIKDYQERFARIKKRSENNVKDATV